MDYKKQIFAAVLSVSLLVPVFALALTEDPPTTTTPDSAGSEPSSGETSQSSCSVIAILGSTDCNEVPTKVPLGVPRDIANKIAWGIAKMLVHKLTEQIVMMIRTGGQGGGPLFVQDWNQFLLDAADQASGVFIKELNLTQLCEPFAPRLRLIFAGGRRSFQDRYRCTVSTVMGNIQGFFDDFNNGGWQRWIELTQVQNNPYGQYLGLLEEKEKREALAAQASFNEAMSANGFLGKKDCSYPQIEHGMGDQPVGNRCLIVSPGTYLENRLAEATTDDIRQLNLAQSFD